MGGDFPKKIAPMFKTHIKRASHRVTDRKTDRHCGSLIKYSISYFIPGPSSYDACHCCCGVRQFWRFRKFKTFSHTFCQLFEIIWKRKERVNQIEKKQTIGNPFLFWNQTHHQKLCMCVILRWQGWWGVWSKNGLIFSDWKAFYRIKKY